MPRKKLTQLKQVKGSEQTVKAERRIIDVTCKTGACTVYTQKDAMGILGIKQGSTFKSALKILEIQAPVKTSDLKRLLGLRLFLQINHGDRRASKQTYRDFELAGRIEELHAHYDIDIEAELTRRKNDFYCQQRYPERQTANAS